MVEASLLDTRTSAPGAGQNQPPPGGNQTNGAQTGGGLADSTATTLITLPENWKEALPIELRDDPSMKVVNDVPTLVKNYIHTKKQVGAGKIAIPDKHATDEDWQQVYSALGRPEGPDKYEVNLDEETMNKESFEKFKTQAHKLGFTNRQLQGVVDWVKEDLVESGKQAALDQVGLFEKSKSELKTSWGEKYDSNLMLANLALKHFGDDKFMSYVKETGLSNEPTFVKFLAKLGENFREDVVKGRTPGNGLMSPQELDQRISEIRGNQQHPYHVKDHPNHDAAVKEMADLYARRFNPEAS